MTARPWSLAARLTAWYSGSAFALVLLATGVLYWALARNLDREDDEFLADKVRVLLALLADPASNAAAIRQEVEEAGLARQHTPVLVRILGPDGVLAETAGMDRTLPPDAFPPPAPEPRRGAEVAGAGRTFRALSIREPGAGLTVQAALDRGHEQDLLADYRRDLAIVLGTALVACAAVGHTIARRGLRPVEAVARTAARVDPGHLGERIATAGLPAELLALASTFNAMLDRLEESFTRLRRFSADIAHELRTPVGNLRGEIEVALGRPRSAEEYREVLGSGLEECGRLAGLIDGLLFLARAESPRAQIGRERLDVAEELRAVSEFYEATAAEAGVRLAVAGDRAVPAELNRPLFQRAVGNLLANALAHTPPGGSVTLTARQAGSEVEVEVTDTGGGIPAEHLPHVFDRFYRADEARSGGGVGLGLAIVRGIVELHGGTAEVHSEPGSGTRVRLIFPVAAGSL